MQTFDDELNQRLAAITAQGLHRQLRRIDSPQIPQISCEGRTFLNFSSNDYLGLANERSLKEAAKEAIDQFGAGSGASRLICGSLGPHHRLEQALAEFKGTQASLAFSSGYATALGTLGALMGKDDVIIVDKLVHASIVDAARLCGAKLRVFPHNDLGGLEKILRWADGRGVRSPKSSIQGPKSEVQSQCPRVLIVTESIFSMDGDAACLREIVELKEKYGAWLMVDEAHATGLYGPHRRGLAEACDLAERVEIQMGTLGKALGSAGGYICGSRALIDVLVNRARSFIFSTAPTPATAAAATAGIRFVQSDEGEGRRTQLWARLAQLKSGLAGGRWNAPLERSAIVPLIVGAEDQAVRIAAELRRLGIFIPAIRYPAVGLGQARLRLTLSALHTTADVEQLLQALHKV